MQLISPVNKATLIEIRDFILDNSEAAPSFEQIITIVRKVQVGLIDSTDDGLDHRFALQKDGIEVMATEVDRADPRIDTEFWTRFLQGDVTMTYVGSKVREALDLQE